MPKTQRRKKRPFSNTIEGQRGTGIALSARLGRDTHPFDLIGRNKSGDIGEHSLAGLGLARNIGATFKRGGGLALTPPGRTTLSIID